MKASENHGHFEGKRQERLGKEPSSLVRIECNAGADVLGYMHEFFTSFCEGHFRPNVAQKLTSAAFELLENGLSYGGITRKVTIELLQGNSCLLVSVSNDAIPARVAILTAHVQKLRANAQKVYVEEMNKTLSGAGQRAMLGLARLAHEANLELAVHIEGRSVTVEAYCLG